MNGKWDRKKEASGHERQRVEVARRSRGREKEE